MDTAAEHLGVVYNVNTFFPSGVKRQSFYASIDMCVIPGLLLLGAKLDPRNSRYIPVSSIPNKGFNIHLRNQHIIMTFFLKINKIKQNIDIGLLLNPLSMTSYFRLLHTFNTTTTLIFCGIYNPIYIYIYMYM